MAALWNLNIEKGNLATPTGEQAPINTPKASRSTVFQEYPALLKLKVEELFQYNRETSSILRRDYILQNIEEESISIGKRFSKAHLHEKDSSVISISDLFNLVKQYPITKKQFSRELIN